jgi:muconolactone delta-isomerase
VVQVLALERSVPGVCDDAFTPTLLSAEAACLWELHQSGVVRQMFFRTDRHAAVLLLEVAGPEAATEALGQLPLVSSGLIDFEIVPLRAYPGLARLFG